MTMWDSIPVKNFIVPVLYFRIGLGNDFFLNLDFIYSDMEKLSTCEEVAHNTLGTLNQVIAKYTKTAKYGMSIMV